MERLLHAHMKGGVVRGISDPHLVKVDARLKGKWRNMRVNVNEELVVIVRSYAKKSIK